jgi:hypothetical protein
LLVFQLEEISFSSVGENMEKIFGGLYIGNGIIAKDYDKLLQIGITHIVRLGIV